MHFLILMGLSVEVEAKPNHTQQPVRLEQLQNMREDQQIHHSLIRKGS